MTSLLGEILILLERTYGKSGVVIRNLLITSKYARELDMQAGPNAADLSDLGRLYIIETPEGLRLFIDYDKEVVAMLKEYDPRRVLNENNVRYFIVLVEELDHAVHAMLKFRDGYRDIHSEEFVRDLELQAKIDTFLVLNKFYRMMGNCQRTQPWTFKWIMACVFEFDSFVSKNRAIAERYAETNLLGRRYVEYLVPLAKAERTARLRKFRALSYRQKRAHIDEICKPVRIHLN